MSILRLGSSSPVPVVKFLNCAFDQVEDMLGMVHNGVIKTFHMFDYDPEHPDVIRERDFINKKLEALKMVGSTDCNVICIRCCTCACHGMK